MHIAATDVLFSDHPKYKVIYKKEMNKKTIESEKYGMVLCPCCNGVGYIQNLERQCCPKCGGFGLVKREVQEDMNTSPLIKKGEGT